MRTAKIGPDLRLPKIKRICMRKTILATQTRFPYNVVVNFEFRSKLSLTSVICMDPRPTNYLRQIYCFLIPGDDSSFFFFISFSFGFLLFYVIINFYKNYFIIIIVFKFFFHENYFYFFMFRDVPECSGMFRVPGFIDAPILAVVIHSL